MLFLQNFKSSNIYFILLFVQHFHSSLIEKHYKKTYTHNNLSIFFILKYKFNIDKIANIEFLYSHNFAVFLAIIFYFIKLAYSCLMLINRKGIQIWFTTNSIFLLHIIFKHSILLEQTKVNNTPHPCPQLDYHDLLPELFDPYQILKCYCRTCN